MEQASKHWQARLPFYYGWLIVAIAFVTMAIDVTGRTAFSLLMPPLIDEFKWDRGLAAGAFSFGFLVSAVLSPIVGRVIDTRGPRIEILTGVALMSAGLLLAPWITRPWHLYATLGVAVGGGANMMTYTAHSQFLPNWFVRRRGLAISIAFAGRALVPFCCCPGCRPSFSPRAGAHPALRWVGCGRPKCRGDRRSGLDGDRMDARPSGAHVPVLVDRDRLFPRADRLVRRARRSSGTNRIRCSPDENSLASS